MLLRSLEMVSREDAARLNKDRSWMRTTIKMHPSVKTQVAQYCALHGISASILILRAIAEMGVQIDDQDLNPTNKGGRRVIGCDDSEESKRVVLPFQIRKYVRFRVARQIRKTPELSFTAFIMVGLAKMGFDIPEDHTRESAW